MKWITKENFSIIFVERRILFERNKKKKEDEEYLRQISKEVDFKTDNYKEYIENLKWYVENNDVYALASVQIGIPKRIIYIKKHQSKYGIK